METVETTFWLDFTIADAFGESAVRDTFKRAFGEWRTDARYLAQLSMTLNHKIWQHWEAGNESLAEVYDELWRKADSWAWDNLKGEDIEHYYQVTD